MSGILLKYKGRAFWSKRLVDIWSYHLAHLLLKLPDAPVNLIEYSRKIMEYARTGCPDFMFNFIEDYENHSDLLIELSQKILDRLDHYDTFLADEALHLGCNITDFKQQPEGRFEYSNITDIDMLGYLTLSNFNRLHVFGKLVIKMLTGEGWTKAYFNTYAKPIDYLEDIKPNGDVGHSYIYPESKVEVMGIRQGDKFLGTYWISKDNTSCKLEYSHGILPNCIGIPDLLISYKDLIVLGVDDIEEEIDWDDFELKLAQELGLRERWLLDFKQQVTLVVSTIGTLSHKRYNADEDFYSEALGKMVNLKFLYDIGKNRKKSS